MQPKKQPSLFSAITLGVGSIIGSGWLFASYYAVKHAGPISILSWVIGAFVALVLALLLAEITTIYQETGLLSRLLTITHNRDYGFIIAMTNWLAMIAAIASEAMASVEYIMHAFPTTSRIMFAHGSTTWKGLLVVYSIICLYGLINYWGIRVLSATNNIITAVKLVVPTAIGIIFIVAEFHHLNFINYKHSIAPYGFSRAFSAVVNCGIFYAFYGFSSVAVFAKELKNPERNIPLALISAVVICLIIYLILQISFIGAINPDFINNSGWHQLQFNSPLADLAILLGMNWIALILYVDAAISPSGTAIIFTGSGARMLYGMAEDKQMPKIFAKLNPKFVVPRVSLIFTLLMCGILVVYFNSWQKIMIIVSVFQLTSCLAIPIAFGALRKNQPNTKRLFKMPVGSVFNLCAYFCLSYLLVDCGLRAMLLALILYVSLFIVYCVSYYKFRPAAIYNAIRSSWTIFIYMAILSLFALLRDKHLFNTLSALVAFVPTVVIFYILSIRQKHYTTN